MLRNACDYCKTLWDRFKQLINCDNDISRCAREHYLDINASKEKPFVKFEMYAIDCETSAWNRFRQLINCDNDINRCVRGALFKYKCCERALKIR